MIAKQIEPDDRSPCFVTSKAAADPRSDVSELCREASEAFPDAPDIESDAQEFCSGAPDLCRDASESFPNAPDIESDAQEFCSEAPDLYPDAPDLCWEASEAFSGTHGTTSGTR